jgi:hypothetical protein
MKWIGGGGMTEQQKQVFWKSITFGGMACATLLVLGLATLSVVSGAELDFGEAATPATVILAAFILRRRNGESKNGGSAPLAGAVLLALMVPALAGCGAPCTTERAIVSAVDVGIASADTALGDDIDEETQQALYIAGGVASLGNAAVEACELLRDGGGWQQWVGLAFEAATGLLAHFTGAPDGDAPDAPPELVEAVGLLEAAQLEPALP